MRVTDLPDGVRVIAPSGFLDFAAVVKLENEFRAQVEAAPGGVILDMAEVPFCGSLGIRMLLSASRATKKRGRRLAIAAVHPDCRQVFETACLDSLIPIAPTIEDAKALVGR
ncbi:STAS domain-containing protein [Falsiroseomonas sp. HW251]|uniref:STAS domain-containing protein n=1 Tax=Falsiroseomonas sp. HW251 TaxID=3390998 RepID=UPI003D321D7E